MNGPCFVLELFSGNTLKEKRVTKLVLLRSCVRVIRIEILYKRKKDSLDSFLNGHCLFILVTTQLSIHTRDMSLGLDMDSI